MGKHLIYDVDKGLSIVPVWNNNLGLIGKEIHDQGDALLLV